MESDHVSMAEFHSVLLYIKRLEQKISHLESIVDELSHEVRPAVSYVNNRLDGQQEVVKQFMREKVESAPGEFLSYSSLRDALLQYALSKGVEVHPHEFESLMERTYLKKVTRNFFEVGYEGGRLK
jgi:hypothetical protein